MALSRTIIIGQDTAVRRAVRRWLACLLLLGIMPPGCGPDRDRSPPAPSARLVPAADGSLAHASLELIGLSDENLRDLHDDPRLQERASAILALYQADPGPVLTQPLKDVVPLAGTYTVQNHALRLTPEQPLEPGRRYRAIIHLSSLGQSATAPIEVLFPILRDPAPARSGTRASPPPPSATARTDRP